MCTFFSCFVTAVIGIYIGYLIGILTTLERRFEIPSSQSGALLSAYDIGHAIFVLLVGHYGAYLHQPKLIGIGSLVSGFGALGLASPHFIFGATSPNHKSFNNNSEQFAVPGHLCLKDASNISHHSTAETCSAEQNFNAAPYAVLVLFQLLVGIGSCTLNTLTYVYIDDNCSKKQAPFYLGIFSH